MKKTLLYLLLALATIGLPQSVYARKKGSQPNVNQQAKREFRGAWIQTAFQERYMRMSPEQAQAYLLQMVQQLQATGINTILFQVRSEGDAFYRSTLEPWSRFLTGKQGVAPNPEWDPMAFLITECHKRNIEFHAWVNPYRMSASKNMQLPQGHLYYQHPEWFVRFDDRLYLNPGMPECRSYVRQVVSDIVSRYDVDGLHIDDYFYPYPVPGKTFNDRATFQAYAPVMGYDAQSDADWAAFRRHSVNILIKGLHDDIRALKPWVRFGVSPFGIYRNQQSWPEGSLTHGTQCYDDLYADVLLWAQEGWIDYLIPQLYWEIGHTAADYSTLVQWWAQHTPQQCQLYIGQSIERSLDGPANSKRNPDLLVSHQHFTNKLQQAASQPNVLGNCFWYAYQITDNAFNAGTWLRDSLYASQPVVLPPAYNNIDPEAPKPVRNVEVKLSEQGLHVSWRVLHTTDPLQQPQYYVVYRFNQGEKLNLTDGTHIVCKTPCTEFFETNLVPGKFTYVITAIDACNNESEPVRKTVKVKIR